MHLIDKSFVKAPGKYIAQSALATLAVLIVLHFVQVLIHAVIIAAIASSAFIVFAMPHSMAARPRRLIGGHVVGLFSGIGCHYLFLSGPVGKLVMGKDLTILFVYALAVGLSIFLMTITDTQHPPASGTALGIIVQPWSYEIVAFVLLSVIALAIIRRLLLGCLGDLSKSERT